MKDTAVGDITRKFWDRVIALAPKSVDSLADSSFVLIPHSGPQPSNTGRQGVSSYCLTRYSPPRPGVPNSTSAPIESYFIDVYLGGIDVTPRDGSKLTFEEREKIKDLFTRKLNTQDGREITSSLTDDQKFALVVEAEVQANYRNRN